MALENIRGNLKPGQTVLEAVMEKLEEVARQGYTHVHFTPFTRPTDKKSPAKHKPEKCPYAIEAADLNPVYTGGRNVSYEETEMLIRKMVDRCRSLGMEPVYDIAMNHIGYGARIFDPVRRKELFDDPIFGELARAADSGRVNPETLFDDYRQKRKGSISGQWLDVRQARIDEPERMEILVEYFYIPWLKWIAKLGFRALRVDAAAVLPEDFVRRIAPFMAEILGGEKGSKILVLMEALGESPKKHRYLVDAFTDLEDRATVYALNSGLWGITADCGHIYPETLKAQLAGNNQHVFWALVHSRVLGSRQIGVVGTHDTMDEFTEMTCLAAPHEAENRHSLRHWLRRHISETTELGNNHRFFISLLMLSRPGLMMTAHHEHILSRQYEWFNTQPVVTSSEDEKTFSFIQAMNIVHGQLYQDRSYTWQEIAFNSLWPDNYLHIFRPEAGYRGDPEIVFANTEGQAQPSLDAEDYTALIDSLLASKTSPDRQASFGTLHLLGEFEPTVARKIATYYRSRGHEVMCNGRPVPVLALVPPLVEESVAIKPAAGA
ncbi:MAG: alpha-amylase family protein [Pseudomonadota bacterium]|nr:alpha-amylase family protein [Pseudomonadota bacterium]